MSVMRVTLSASDEEYAPPGHEIDICVVGNDVAITVYEGSADDLIEGRKKQYAVPLLAYCDLLSALNAFSDTSQGIRLVRPERPA